MPFLLLQRARHRAQLAGLGAAFAALLAGMPVQAQFLMGKNWGDLTKDDIDRLNEAAGKLSSGVPAGTVEQWSNPTSGNRGTVKLLNEYEQQGLVCQTIQQAIKFKKLPDTRAYVMKRCQLPDGQWKFY